MRSTLLRHALRCAADSLSLLWKRLHWDINHVHTCFAGGLSLIRYALLQVAERAALIDEVAIGLITRVGLLLLAPHIAHRRVYRNTDRIVVFAAAGR